MLATSTRKMTPPAVALNGMMDGEVGNKSYPLPQYSVLSSTVTKRLTVGTIGSFPLPSHVPTPPPAFPGIISQGNLLLISGSGSRGTQNWNKSQNR